MFGTFTECYIIMHRGDTDLNAFYGVQGFDLIIYILSLFSSNMALQI